MSEILPLVPSLANYSFVTTLDGDPYIIAVRWNARDGAWYMDLFASDDDPIYQGMKLVLGAYVGLKCADARMPGIFLVVDTSGAGVDAGFDDIGYDPVTNAPRRVMVHFLSYAS